MTKIFTRLLTCWIMLSTVHAIAQDDPNTLPKGLTPEEVLLQSNYQPPVAPSSNIDLNAMRGNGLRTMAEWEELQAVVITWTGFQAILAEIVRSLQPECKLVIVCNNISTVKNYLIGKNIDPEWNTLYLQAPFNSIWVRDYGPNPVYINDVDSLILIDWIYNRPRPNDDLVPYPVGTALGIPVIGTTSPPNDLVHTGGNFMSDGLGFGFSSELVLDENGPDNKYGISNHSEAGIDAIMYDFMGISPYVKMKNLPYDGIHHIDMHMKLLNESTLLVGQYPAGIADGPQIEANLQYVINNFETTFGRPFNVIRIPMPPDGTGKYPHQGGHYRTYTNSLIANKTVIVPTYAEQYDTTALRIYREAMPGYNVVGINCNAIIPSSGALHCITKEIGVSDPMWIVHDPVDGQIFDDNGVPIEAIIKHRSGIVSGNLYFSSDTLAGYTMVPMIFDPISEKWQGYIPLSEEGTQIFYFIEGTAENGKTLSRPITAPQGYWTFFMPEQPSSFIPTNTVNITLGTPFPNPARAITCIPVTAGNITTAATLSVIDAMGRVVSVLYSGDLPGDKKFFINAADFVPGVYSVLLQGEGFSQYEMLVVID